MKDEKRIITDWYKNLVDQGFAERKGFDERMRAQGTCPNAVGNDAICGKAWPHDGPCGC